MNENTLPSPQPTPYPLSHLQGDLMIDNNLTIGGRQRVMQTAHFKRDVIIEGTLFCRHYKSSSVPSSDEPAENTSQKLETEISVDTSHSQNPATTEAIFNAVDSVQGDVDVHTQDIDALTERVTAIEQGGAGSGSQPGSPLQYAEDADETRYPEYYGAKADGINYYDWPLRCYNGEVNIPADQIQTAPYTGKVFAPSERIAYRYTNMPAFISTEQVYFNTATHQFVLAVVSGGTTWYYHQWGADAGWNNSWDDAELWDHYCGTSAEWNDEDTYDANGVMVRQGTGLARTDTVFSDISPDPENAGKLNRVSYVFRDGGLVNILDTMTNDEAAIDECIRKTKGNMRLHRGKIYFMLKTKAYNNISGLVSEAPYRNLRHFVTDGQGGTLFVRSLGTRAYNGEVGGNSCNSVFTINNCEHGVIRNISIRALRDRDNGAPNGHRRFSSSCSRLIAFNLGDISAPKDLRFENIEMQGFYSDFSTHRPEISDIVIDGYKSTELCQNWMAAAKNITIRHFHVIQNGFCGDGMHLIYGSGRLKGLFVSDGVFDVSAPFSSVMLSFHGPSPVTEEDTYLGIDTVSDMYVLPTSIHFDNVDFCAIRALQGNAMTDTPQWIHLRNCRLMQKYDKMLFSGGLWDRNKTLIVASGVNWDFDNCCFSLLGAHLMDYVNETTLTLIMNHCGIFTKDTYADNVSSKLISGFKGTLVTEGVMHNWPGTKGVDFTQTSAVIRRALQAGVSQIDSIHATLYGDSYNPRFTTDANGVYPLEVTVGDYVNNLVTGQVEQCTEAASESCVCLKCNTPPLTDGTGDAISGMVTIYTKTVATEQWKEHAKATLSLPQGAVSTAEELAAALKTVFEAAGYITSFPVSGNLTLLSVFSAGASVIGQYTASYVMVELTGLTSGLVTMYTTTAIAASDGVTGDYLKFYRKGSLGAGTPVESGGLVDQVSEITTRVSSLSSEMTAKSTDIEELKEKIAVAAVSDEALPAQLSVGYTYFDETAGKPLWLKSIAQDGSYNWVDATGTPYVTYNGQAGL